MITEYDRQWLLSHDFSHEDILGIEQVVIKLNEKYPRMGECTSYAAAYKYVIDAKRKKIEQDKAKAKAEAKFEQDKLNGLGMDYQNGVWAPFNGKVYHDRAKMVADAKAVGLEETGGSTDMDFMQKRAAEVKRVNREKARIDRRWDIKQSLAQSMKSH